jgi:hypothetical protein
LPHVHGLVDEQYARPVPEPTMALPPMLPTFPLEVVLLVGGVQPEAEVLPWYSTPPEL